MNLEEQHIESLKKFRDTLPVIGKILTMMNGAKVNGDQFEYNGFIMAEAISLLETTLICLRSIPVVED